MMISKVKCGLIALLFIALPTYTYETEGTEPSAIPPSSDTRQEELENHIRSKQNGNQTRALQCDDRKKPKCPIVKPACPVFTGENGEVVTNNSDNNNSGSLRFAINQANDSKATPDDPFVIEFDLPVDDNRILITEGDLIIKKPVCINGFTNQGASEFERTLTVELCTNTPDQVENGLVLTSTACGSTIKGLAIMSFNSGSGILVHASGSLIAGNNIGRVNEEIETCGQNGNDTNSTGITIDGAEHVTIGGLCPNERNVISGNEQNGISIKSSNVTVVGNYIGTDPTGLFAILGQNKGIAIEGNCNIIGCSEKCGGNLIAAQGDEGILLLGSYNKIVNAVIGLDARGKRPIPNTQGVKIEGNYNTILDSVISGNRNVFDNNDSNANIHIQGSFNTIRRCLIGTDLKGEKSFASPIGIKIGFGTTGMIDIQKSTNNLIEENHIAVRSGIGIQIAAGSSNSIRKNRIGSNLDETCSLGQTIGIDLVSLACTVDDIGTNDTTARQRIVDYALPGQESQQMRYERPPYGYRASCEVPVPSSRRYEAPYPHSQIRAEQEATGTCSRPCGTCDLEQLQAGCCQNLPFPTETVANCITGNIILGNLCYGIKLDSASRFTKIEKNLIGVNKRCRFVPNGYGIFITGAAQNNKIDCNLIAGNLFNGIGVQGVISEEEDIPFAQTINNTMSKNRIFGNCRSGIRLSAGGNDCLGAPLITHAQALDGTVEVTIEVASLPENVPFTIELYGNTRCRKCVSEGERFLCCKTVREPLTEDELTIAAPLPCLELEFVTATVTQLTSCFAGGNTSEFSCPVRIIKPPVDDESVRIMPLLETAIVGLDALA